MSGSRQFTIAGSLYDAASSSTSVSGATITIHDNAGQTITLVSGTDGAFYTTQSVSFPISITASKCPDTQTMPAQSSSGDCNSCHGSGTRIHLP
jgi:spore germination protein YaaH